MILKLDFQGDVPLYLQIRNQVVIAISNKELLPGDHLPTVRSLSDESGVNTMTISKAYQTLKSEGFIITDRRGGAVVCNLSEGTKASEQQVERLKLCISEMKASGLGEDLIMDLCKKIYKGEMK